MQLYDVQLLTVNGETLMMLTYAAIGELIGCSATVHNRLASLSSATRLNAGEFFGYVM